jgi:hypothetical protein
MVSLAMCGLFASPAQALTAHLRGAKADAFVARHFPNADIPGMVQGRFTYGGFHHRRRGRATCNVPAMGARSDGAVSTCTVVY